MPTLNNWQPCYAEPERGTAFFDGIFIEADSITNPRRDRVLPILKEEQILVCRLLTPLFEGRKNQRRSLVLDIGTGSGVFAIAAAKSGCHVVAIDLSRRACECAKRNATLNGIKLAASLSELRRSECGAIWVTEASFDRKFDLGCKFDIIILAPPYNPTHTDLGDRVAMHANAGSIGMTAFNEQIRFVRKHLKIGGWCCGNQMTPLTAAAPQNLDCATIIRQSWRKVLAIKRIHDTFEHFSCHCVAMLPGVCDTNQFLTEQYSRIRNQLENFDTWKNAIARKYPQLMLLYFRFQNNSSGVVSLTAENIPTENGAAIHGKTWSDRAWLHQQIVEHTSHRGTSSLPGFLFGPGPDRINSVPSDLLVNSEKPLDEAPKTLLDILGFFIKAESLGDLFSLIFVDTAPIYPEQNGQSSIQEACRVWIHGENKANGNEKDAQLRNLLLNYWQRTTVELQTNLCGPFSHADFTGFISRQHSSWPEILSSEYKDFLEQGKKSPIFIARQIINNRQNSTHKRRAFDPACKNIPGVTISPSEGSSQSDLKALRVESFAANFEKMRRRLVRLAKALKKNRVADINLTEIILTQMDLLGCHANMHGLVHERFLTAINQFRLPGDLIKTDNSWLFGVPLGFFLPTQNQGVADWPRSYFGGIWFYFLAKVGADQVKMEKASRRLISLGWLITMGLYSTYREGPIRDDSELTGKYKGIRDLVISLQHDFVGRICSHLFSNISTKNVNPFTEEVRHEWQILLQFQNDALWHMRAMADNQWKREPRKMVDCSLHKLVTECFQIVDLLQRSPRCINNIPNSLIIQADPGSLRIVLANLLINAKHSVGEKDAPIIVKMEQSSENGKIGVLVTVEDAGEGFPLEREKEGFLKPGRHINPPGRTVRGGGIGLYLSNRIILDQSAARIRIMGSIVGEMKTNSRGGATVGFFLPQRQTKEK